MTKRYKSIFLCLIILMMVGCSPRTVTETDLEKFITEENIQNSNIIGIEHVNNIFYIFYETDSSIGIYTLHGYQKRYLYGHSNGTRPEDIYIGRLEEGSFPMIITNEELLEQSSYIEIQFANHDTERFDLIQGKKEYVIVSDNLSNPFRFKINFYSEKHELLHSQDFNGFIG